jgi:hypothetical protein
MKKKNRLMGRLITFIGVALLLVSCFSLVWSSFRVTKSRMNLSMEIQEIKKVPNYERQTE